MSDPQSQYPVQGAGLGLRRPLADKLMANCRWGPGQETAVLY
jgi:hypothetical protein